MFPSVAAAEEAAPQRFFGLFYPNGRAPGGWDPPVGRLNPDALPAGLVDLTGFGAEGIWPAFPDLHRDVAVVHNIDHSEIATGIHLPAQSLVAHRWTVDEDTAAAPSLDQVIADRIGRETAYRTLTMSSAADAELVQGNVSWRDTGELEVVHRSPRRLFNTLFGRFEDQDSAERARLRRESILDLVLEDAHALQSRLGRSDQLRVEQYLDSISELERRVDASTVDCAEPDDPGDATDYHGKSKLFMDLSIAAMACDLTRVSTLQYSDTWGVNYEDYDLGEGHLDLRDLSDHVISHKLAGIRTGPLIEMTAEDAIRITDARVVTTSRFKARRFSNLVAALKDTPTPTGTLFDETLALYFSEIGSDNHDRTNMAYLLAGGVGDFEGGRVIDAGGQPTGALHGSILQYFGFDIDEYGDPAAPPLAEL